MHFFTQLLYFLLIYALQNASFVFAIKCEEYNSTACGNNSQNCSYEVDCGKEQCFVLWSSNSSGTHIKLKGCFESKDCHQPNCVDKGDQKAQNLLFCCCEEDRCNYNFTWNPTVPPPTKPPVTRESDDTVTYLVYIVFPLSMVLLLVLMVLLKKRKFSYFSQIPSMDQRAQSPPTPIPEKLRPIQLIEIRARGKFGAVWKATDKNETVAVKIMPIQEKQAWLTEQEIYKLPMIEHDNILYFIDAEKHGDNLRTEFWLITEYHPIGSVYDYLKSNTLTWEQMCHMSYTLTRGLTHLHEEIPSEKLDLYKPAVAHRDLKSSNILLKHDLSACIADFGLAISFKPQRACGDTHGQVGTRRYMAPEVLEGAINFSRDAFLRIDMYACGLVLWELASRCIAQQGTVPDYKLPFEVEIGQHPSLEDIQEIVVHQKRRPLIKNSWRQHHGFNLLCDTIEECWDHDAEARLSASCVMERIFWYSKTSTSPNTALLYNDPAASVINNTGSNDIHSYATA